MRGLVFIVAASIGLSGCAAMGAMLRGGGGSLAVRGAVVEGAVMRAGSAGLATEVAAGQGMRMVALSPRVAAAGEPVFGSAFAEMAAGRSAMVIDSAGFIRTGSRQVVRLQGRRFHIGDETVARLEDGVIYDLSGPAVARLRGFVPGRAVTLELGSGLQTTQARSLLVDVLDLQGGRYLVRTPAGQTAWLEAAALGLVVLSPGDERECARGPGVLVRKSGEPIVFTDCTLFGDALALETAEGRMAVASAEVSDLLYDDAASAFLQSQMNAAA